MPKVTVKCANLNCKGKGFVEVYPYRLKTTKNFFCCPECQVEFNSKPKKPQIAVKCALEGCDKIKYVTETEFKKKKNFFCCKQHHDEFKKNRAVFVCDYCGREFEVPMNRALREQENHFCCKKHHDLFMQKRVKTHCAYCGAVIEMIQSKYERAEKHYCCPEHQYLDKKTNKYEIFDDYAELIITSKTHGEVRIKIDKEDVEKCQHLTWIANYNKRLKSWYIQNISFINGVAKTTYIHRYIMDCPADKEIDHQNHRFDDCRRQNLKIVTRAENIENRGVTRRSTTGVLNVYKYGKKYQVGVTKNGERHTRLGIDTIEEAAKIAKELRNTLMTNNILDRLDEDNQAQ